MSMKYMKDVFKISMKYTKDVFKMSMKYTKDVFGYWKESFSENLKLCLYKKIKMKK